MWIPHADWLHLAPTGHPRGGLLRVRQGASEPSDMAVHRRPSEADSGQTPSEKIRFRADVKHASEGSKRLGRGDSEASARPRQE